MILGFNWNEHRINVSVLVKIRRNKIKSLISESQLFLGGHVVYMNDVSISMYIFYSELVGKSKKIWKPKKHYKDF